MSADLTESDIDVGYRSPFTELEDSFRDLVRTFIKRELEPNLETLGTDWESRHDVWRRAGDAGILGASIPERHGGPGAGLVPNIIISHELARSPCYGTLGSLFCTDMATSVLIDSGNKEMIDRWAPRILSGEAIQSMAITEPDAGSDALSMRGTARREGDVYVLNGSKTFITNGDIADLLYVVLRTSPERSGRSLSMFIIDPSLEGVTRHKLRTMGFSRGNTAELTFDNVRVPANQMLGEEGDALTLMMSSIEYDRLQIAARALGQAELAYGTTVDYVKQRKVFGKQLADFQNTQFVLATMKSEIAVGRAYLHEVISKLRSEVHDTDDCAIAKLWLTEMSGRVIDGCIQLFGGMGFMDETPISRIYTSNRVLRVYAGSSEILRRNIGRGI